MTATPSEPESERETTEQIGIAMLAVARHGAPETILTTADINAMRTG